MASWCSGCNLPYRQGARLSGGYNFLGLHYNSYNLLFQQLEQPFFNDGLTINYAGNTLITGIAELLAVPGHAA